MPIDLLFQIALLICLFLAGTYFIARVVIGRLERIAEGIKAQFRATVNSLPGRLGKEGRGVVDYLVKESVEAEEAEGEER